MAFSTFVGTITQPAATGNQSYTGVGFQPKAIILWLCKQTADGTSANLCYGVGMATGTANRATVALSSEDVVTTSNCDGRHDNAHCLTLIDTAAAVVAEADFVSFDADGFTLNWTTTDATARVVAYLALGGSDLTNAKVVQIQSPGATGNQSTTGVGFQPDCIIALTRSNDTAPPATSALSMFSMGFGTSSSARACTSATSQDAQATSNTWRSQIATGIIRGINVGGTDRLVADVVSMDSDGFTLNYSVDTVARYIWVLCLKGGQYKVGVETQKTATGTKATTGVGFTPTGLLMLSANNTANTGIVAHHRVTIGATSGTANRATVWNGDQDNAALMIANNNLDTNACMKMMTENTLAAAITNAEADLSSFDSDGFTLNWGTADATAREFIYLAMGSPDPARNAALWTTSRKVNSPHRVVAFQ
jgi:hypothetical protein